MKPLLGAVLLVAGLVWGAAVYTDRHAAEAPAAERPARQSAPSTSITDSLASSSAALAAEPQRQDVTVYITDTGEKYHRAGCRHLRRSRHPVKLADAKRRGYEACKVCRPAR